MNVYENFTECYLDLARQVYKNPDYTCAPRGFKIKEKLGVRFKIKNPRDRLPYVPIRKFSATYLIGELLWYLAADNSTDWISYYSSFWKHISDDGKTANSAYGARIFKPHERIAGGSLNQWQFIVDELKSDPDSRRAVIHIRSPWDSVKAKLDVPCTLTLQFFLRHNDLHMVVNMRSSDLILGIAYDIPAFTMFQELLARELGARVGEYIHVSNSLHIYEKHFDMVEDMLKEDSIRLARSLHAMHGSMPRFSGDPPIKELFEYEGALRKEKDSKKIFQLLQQFEEEHADYWADWAKILAAHRFGKLKQPEEKTKLIDSTKFSGYHVF
jgi:thymidylate synthase